MEKAFESFFNQHFKNQGNIPSPFDNEAFSQFISDQIKNAVPNQAKENGFKAWDPQNIPNPSQHKQKKGPNPEQHKGEQQSQEHTNNLNLEYNVFEAHDFVIARIAMATINTEEKYSVLLNSYELFLKEEGQNPALRIHLPKPINPKKTKVMIRDGILEVQMMKQSPEPLSVFEVYEENEKW